MLQFEATPQSMLTVELTERQVRRRTAALVVAVTLLSLLLGTLFIWDRGLYMDDYYTKLASYDIATGAWQVSLTPLVPHARILGQLVQQNMAGLLPNFQLSGRILWAGVHLASVVFLGLIVYQVTESSLARTLAIWLFLMPFWACETILWFTQVGQHGIAALLFLVALYVMLLVIKGHAHRILLACLAFGCVALGLQFSELPISVVGYPPLLALAMIRPGEQRTQWWRRIGIALGLTAICLIIGFIHYKLFTGIYIQTTAARGNLSISVISVAARYADYLKRFYTATLTSTWGLPITQAAFSLGLSTITKNALGNALLILLGLCSALWITTVPLPTGNRRHNAYSASILIMVGSVWMLAALLPGTLVTGQALESRMLYIVLAGFAVAGTGVVWGGTVLLQGHASFVRRILLVIPVSMMVFATITMAGYCQIYKLRYQDDMRQMSALQSVVNPQSLQSPTTFIAMKTDFHLLTQSDETATLLERIFLGVFEVVWAGRPALQMAYGHDDISFVATNHWSAPMAFRLLPAASGTPQTLQVDGTPVPLDEAIVFTYHEGRVVLASPLVVMAPDGHIEQKIELPRAQIYKSQGRQVEMMQVPLFSQ